MAMHYNISVFIDGINRTSQTVMPIKWGDFLDERLDECHLALRNIREKVFAPLTPVEIRIEQIGYYWKRNRYPKVTKRVKDKRYYLVANDNASEFTPGSGVYNHDLELIEITKAAELIVCDTQTVTNDLGRNYTDNPTYATPVWE